VRFKPAKSCKESKNRKSLDYFFQDVFLRLTLLRRFRYTKKLARYQVAQGRGLQNSIRGFESTSRSTFSSTCGSNSIAKSQALPAALPAYLCC